MRTVADVIRASRSNLHNRLNGSAKPRLGYHKARDATILLCLPSWWRSALTISTAALQHC
jgi:hypothetical protein